MHVCGAGSSLQLCVCRHLQGSGVTCWAWNCQVMNSTMAIITAWSCGSTSGILGTGGCSGAGAMGL